ncbi:MAG TPA: preprotein translocase subunit YajC [Gaiellaceae bacterium]|nr:preprotein translocase subunit YajC [Gaiellaceae bacterium]
MSAAGFLIIIVAFVFLWLVVVRPQKRRQVEQQRMISDLRVGDEVLTAGGIYGHVSAIADDVVSVEVAPQLELRVARRAIAGVTRDEPAEPAEPDEPADAPPDENPG